MGFLLGAFGKQMAGSRMRSLQARLMKISSKVRRIHREQETMQKYINNAKKNAINELKLTTNSAIQMAQQNLFAPIFQTYEERLAGGTMSQEEQAKYNADMTKASTYFQTAKSNEEMRMAVQQQQIEEYYEHEIERLIDPLKDEEEELQTEKEMLEGQIQIARQDYEACQKMEQADAKMLAPNYTGAQG